MLKVEAEVLDAVCGVYGITVEDIQAKSRKRPLPEARQMVIVFCNKRISEPHKVTNQDRTSTYHSIDTIQFQIQRYLDTRERYELIRDRLGYDPLNLSARKGPIKIKGVITQFFNKVVTKLKANKMTKKVAQSKQVSDRTKAEGLIAEYAAYEKTKKESASAQKEIELELLELAEKNPKWFEGKTAQFEAGQLKWVLKSKVSLPEDFDLKAFARKYPALVEIKETESIPVNKLKVYLDDPKMGTVIADMGVSIETEDQFKVVV